MKLSVVMITLNEAANIEACLNSVAFADECIVVDSGSTDGTIDIAEKLGARVIPRTDWAGFGVQKNRALDQASGDWVFSIDADERVSTELKEEILAAMKEPVADAYRIPRSTFYCGHFLRYSGAAPDYVVRLWKRGTARFSEDIVHEHVLAEGKIGTLAAPILHYSYRDFEEIIKKVNRYSTDAAVQAYQRGKRASLGDALFHGFWGFFKSYVLKRGFLDGAAGVYYAVSRAELSYYKYMKLRHLHKSSTAMKDFR